MSQKLLDDMGNYYEQDTNFVIDYADGLQNAIIANTNGVSRATVFGRGAERLYQAKGLEKSFFHSDILGSSKIISNRAGEIQNHIEFDPWGKVMEDEWTQLIPQGVDIYFTNHSYDRVLEKYYAQARMYDPDNGRFMSLDPAYADSNLYRYCYNNPVNMVDPDGKAPAWIWVWRMGAAMASNIASQMVWERRNFNEINWWAVTAAGVAGLLDRSANGFRNRRAATFLRNAMISIAINVGELIATRSLSVPNLINAVINGIVSGATNFFNLPRGEERQAVFSAIIAFILNGVWPRSTPPRTPMQRPTPPRNQTQTPIPPRNPIPIPPSNNRNNNVSSPANRPITSPSTPPVQGGREPNLDWCICWCWCWCPCWCWTSCGGSCNNNSSNRRRQRRLGGNNSGGSNLNGSGSGGFSGGNGSSGFSGGDSGGFSNGGGSNGFFGGGSGRFPNGGGSNGFPDGGGGSNIFSGGGGSRPPMPLGTPPWHN